MRQRAICFVFVLLFAALVAERAVGQLPGYPAPRYPKIPDITTVDQLMPYTRYIVSKSSGDKTIVMRPGYGIQGGERVLMLMNDTTDPLVVKAFQRAFVEKNCTVDVLTVPTAPALKEGTIDGADEMRVAIATLPAQDEFYRRLGTKGLRFTSGTLEESIALSNFIAARNYNLVIGPNDTFGQDNAYLAERMSWFTREMLASAATTYPEEILNAIDRKGWEIIRAAKLAHFTEPQGTDIQWTWFPTYWQVVEGTHPEVKDSGGGPMSGNAGYIYGPGRSEDPLIPGHLMGVPEGIVLPESDASGVLVSTANPTGPYPRIEIHFSKHEVVKIVGGGEFGRLLQGVLEKYKDIKYPTYPRQGFGFLVENAIGTNPKIVRQYNVMETPWLKRQWADQRRRSGIVHWGIGIISRKNEDYAIQHGAPTYHYHALTFFNTYEATMQDGRKVLLLDKGHLTTLDDPEVRKIAAKYGDPDDLLREDWIPAIPGINVPGDYMKDYAQDPAAWVTQEHRKAYAEAIERFKQRGGNYDDIYNRK